MGDSQNQLSALARTRQRWRRVARIPTPVNSMFRLQARRHAAAKLRGRISKYSVLQRENFEVWHPARRLWFDLPRQDTISRFQAGEHYAEAGFDHCRACPRHPFGSRLCGETVMRRHLR